MSPNDPEPIFLPILNLLATRKSMDEVPIEATWNNGTFR
jgi:hypothetical protein